MVIFRKFRLASWVTGAFISKHKKIIISGFVIGIVGFFSLRLLLPYLPQPKPTLRIAKIGQYQAEELPQEILHLLSLGLTTITKDGSPAPGLAKNWELSDDGLTYKFSLADNLRWQDGTPINSTQINYHFSDVEMKVLDEKTVQFKLKEPFAPFPTILTSPIFKENFLGIGPYKVRRIYKKGGYIEKISLTGSKNNLVYHFYPTQEAAILGFKLGEIDIVEDMISNNLEDGWSSISRVEAKEDKNKYLGVFFNTQDPLLTDKTIRQALAYAIKDKPSGDKRATGPISPNSWAYNKDVKLYDYDPQKAKDLIKKDNSDKQISLKISTTEPFLVTAEMLKKSWQEVLGFQSEIELVNILPADYQIFLGLQEIPADPDQYLLWHSTRPENITHFKSPKIDKLLEDGRKISNLEDRKEKYADIQRFLTEESPVVFLSYPTSYKLERTQLFTWF